VAVATWAAAGQCVRSEHVVDVLAVLAWSWCFLSWRP